MIDQRIIKSKPIKILAVQFKYLGDAVILTPALKSLVIQLPSIELHVLVAAEVAPLLENLPWITKVWAMPRRRGKLNILHLLPIIQALRNEKFDRSVDFGGNDRGAVLSLLSGARIRLGPIDNDRPKFLQRISYTETVKRVNPAAPYFDLHFELLRVWQVQRPSLHNLEIACDTRDSEIAEKLLPKNSIICHITTSQEKKDWPITHWQALYHLAHQEGFSIYFSAGNNERERNLLKELHELVPEANMLPPMVSLNLFLNVLKNAKIFISGDTGPLHFAEGLGVPVLGIFAVANSVKQVAPIYQQSQLIFACTCACEAMVNNLSYCQSKISCMASIRPEAVFQKLITMLNSQPKIGVEDFSQNSCYM